MIIARLSLRLSLNNPSKISHSSKNICRKNDRARERERERNPEGKSDRKRTKKNGTKEEGKRAGEQGTTGCISLIGFARSVNVHYSIWLV